MPATSTFLAFTLASTLLAVAPGPSLVLLVAVGTERGTRAAVLTSLGLALGTSTWVAVTAAGLGAVLGARPGLLDAVTVTGAAYLVWLAVRALRHDHTDDPGAAVVHEVVANHPSRIATGRAGGRPLLDGVVVNLLNPSLALFLAALLPPFLDPGRGTVWLQVVALGAVLVVVSTTVNTTVGVLGARLGGRLRATVGDRRTAIVVASVYAGLAVAALLATLA